MLLRRSCFGDINPSAKLPVTFEADRNDKPGVRIPILQMTAARSVHYDEGIFVGYRGYDHLGVEPLFPFGFGLSYAQFEYSNLKLESVDRSDPFNVKVTFEIRNTGDRAWGGGSRNSMCLRRNRRWNGPVRELKGFAKISLLPGESKRTTLLLERQILCLF